MCIARYSEVVPKRAQRLSPDARRQQILDAALDLADAHGFDRLTAREVATKISAAPALVHHYFASMDELITSAFDQFASALLAESTRVIAQQPSLPALCGFISQQLNVSERDARLWMSAWASSQRRPILAAAVEHQMLAQLALLTDLLGRGADEGVFEVGDAHQAAYRILCLLDGAFVQFSMRASQTYGNLAVMVWETVEREVGLRSGILSGGSQLGQAPVATKQSGRPAAAPTSARVRLLET
jgi:AcrR family transcriptional regulator